MKFIPAPGAAYSEIYQDSSLKFAFAIYDKNTDTLQQVHDFVKCRDFLNDALLASKQGVVSSKIYGFSYDGENSPISNKHPLMILKGDGFDYLINGLRLLNKVEEGIKSRMSKVVDIPGTSYKLLKFSPVYLRSTVTISLYTHIIRALHQYDSSGYEDLFSFLKEIPKKYGKGSVVEYQGYIDSFLDLELLFVKIRSIFKLNSEFPDASNSTDISQIHDGGGIVSFSKVVEYGYEDGYEDEDGEWIEPLYAGYLQYHADAYNEIKHGKANTV